MGRRGPARGDEPAEPFFAAPALNVIERFEPGGDQGGGVSEKTGARDGKAKLRISAAKTNAGTSLGELDEASQSERLLR